MIIMIIINQRSIPFSNAFNISSDDGSMVCGKTPISSPFSLTKYF